MNLTEGINVLKECIGSRIAAICFELEEPLENGANAWYAVVCLLQKHRGNQAAVGSFSSPQDVVDEPARKCLHHPQLGEDHTEREEIGTAIEGPSQKLFGGHVGNGPVDITPGVVLRGQFSLNCHGHSEVRDFHRPVG